MPLSRRIGLWLIGSALGLGTGEASAEVVAVVSARSTVSTLSRNQIIDIFLGRSNRFPDGSEAIPVDQAEGSAVRDEFYQRFAGRSPAQVKAHWSKIIFTGKGQPPRQAAGNADVKRLVVTHPGAIGYIERNDVDASVKALLTE